MSDAQEIQEEGPPPAREQCLTVKLLHQVFGEADPDWDGVVSQDDIFKIMGTLKVPVERDDIFLWCSNNGLSEDSSLEFNEFAKLVQYFHKKSGGSLTRHHGAGTTMGETNEKANNLVQSMKQGRLNCKLLRQKLANLESTSTQFSEFMRQGDMHENLAITKKAQEKLADSAKEMKDAHGESMRTVRTLHAAEIRPIKKRVKEAIESAEYAMEQSPLGQVAQGMAMVNRDVSKLSEDVATIGRVMHDIRVMWVEDFAFAGTLSNGGSRYMRELQGAAQGKLKQKPIFNSGAAVREYLDDKMDLLAQWLIERTKFTEADRKKYTDKIQEVRRKREEYEANQIILTKELEEVSKKSKEMTGMIGKVEQENVEMRAALSNPTDRAHDKAEEKELNDALGDCMVAISEGQKEKFSVSGVLFKKEHELVLERHKISNLQVELGELKIILEDLDASQMH